MNEFKKDLTCNITLICVLAFSFVHILLLTLNLFSVTSLKFFEGFNYLIAYVLVVVCLGLYVFGFFIKKINGLEIPAWFRMMFYIAFYLFTNVYYSLGLFKNIYALVAFFVYIAFLVNIVSLSVFYNVQKDEKNRLKSTNKFLITSVFFYATAINALIQFVINVYKWIVVPNFKYSTLTMFVVEMSAMILVTIVMAVIFACSLNRTKTVVNGCLIKVGVKKSTRTIKQ